MLDGSRWWRRDLSLILESDRPFFDPSSPSQLFSTLFDLFIPSSAVRVGLIIFWPEGRTGWIIDPNRLVFWERYAMVDGNRDVSSTKELKDITSVLVPHGFVAAGCCLLWAMCCIGKQHQLVPDETGDTLNSQFPFNNCDIVRQVEIDTCQFRLNIFVFCHLSNSLL